MNRAVSLEPYRKVPFINTDANYSIYSYSYSAAGKGACVVVVVVVVVDFRFFLRRWTTRLLPWLVDGGRLPPASGAGASGVAGTIPAPSPAREGDGRRPRLSRSMAVEPESGPGAAGGDGNGVAGTAPTPLRMLAMMEDGSATAGALASGVEERGTWRGG